MSSALHKAIAWCCICEHNLPRPEDEVHFSHDDIYVPPIMPCRPPAVVTTQPMSQSRLPGSMVSVTDDVYASFVTRTLSHGTTNPVSRTVQDPPSS